MHHFGSVEGRDASPAPKIGSLGGDLGEWLLGLAAYEAVKNEARGHDERGNRLPRISLQWWQVRWVRRQLLAGECATAPSHAVPSRSGQVEWWLFVHLFLCRLWHPERKLSFSHVTDEARLQARSPSPHPPTHAPPACAAVHLSSPVPPPVYSTCTSATSKPPPPPKPPSPPPTTALLLLLPQRTAANAATWHWARGAEVDDAATKPRTWGRWWGLQYYVMWHWNQGSEFWKMVTDPSSAAEQLGVRRDDTRRPSP